MPATSLHAFTPRSVWVGAVPLGAFEESHGIANDDVRGYVAASSHLPPDEALEFSAHRGPWGRAPRCLACRRLPRVAPQRRSRSGSAPWRPKITRMYPSVTAAGLWLKAKQVVPDRMAPPLSANWWELIKGSRASHRSILSRRGVDDGTVEGVTSV